MDSKHTPNAYRVVGSVAYLSLTLGKETQIDLRDLPLALQYRWSTLPAPSGKFYVHTRIKNLAPPPKQKTLFLHRLLTGATDLWVDHIDGDGLNNRRSNLRPVTPKQNAQNKHPINGTGAYSTSKSGVRGVSAFKSKSGRMYWCVRHTINGVQARPRYFAFDAGGFEKAKAFAEQQRADHMSHAIESNGSVLPLPEKTPSASGIPGVQYQEHQRNGRVYTYWIAQVTWARKTYTKSFPWTDAGKAQAGEWYQAELQRLSHGEAPVVVKRHKPTLSGIPGLVRVMRAGKPYWRAATFNKDRKRYENQKRFPYTEEGKLDALAHLAAHSPGPPRP